MLPCEFDNPHSDPNLGEAIYLIHTNPYVKNAVDLLSQFVLDNTIPEEDIDRITLLIHLQVHEIRKRKFEDLSYQLVRCGSPYSKEASDIRTELDLLLKEDSNLGWEKQ